MIGPVHQRFLAARHRGQRLLWLLDPDKIDPAHPDPRWEQAEDYGVAAILIGTSQDGNPDFDAIVARVRRQTQLPLILFPGSAAQVSPHVDAVLFLTLLSGRNPDYLVGEQVRGTPLVRAHGIEPIPTGYILVDTGSRTSVAHHSNTEPLPECGLDAICDHALCAQYMGQAFVYLEAGSGAARSIAPDVIAAVRAQIAIPLIVGGGIKTPAACRDAVEAGADFVVVGTALERDRSVELLRALVNAAHRTAIVVEAET
ncbi:MAG: geranylgeranylglyceryl/heptaprenylglyceryl phosphate synthase [Candidatus Zixiibacteriota bacterium]